MNKLVHEQVLYTQVRVTCGNAGGSGTVIYSGKDEEGFYSTYILTCHHVVSGAIKVEKKWISMLGCEKKVDLRQPVTVEFFNWGIVPHGDKPLTSGIHAEIVAYDQDHDIAILKMKL